MKNKNIWFLILFIFFILLSFGCEIKKYIPQAWEGILDLSNWDFKSMGPLKLDGQWGFFWQTLLSDIDHKQAINENYINVPGLWNGYKYGNQVIDAQGYATYYLNIKMKSVADMLAFKIPDINTAYNFWVDGKMLATNGRVGITPEEMKAQYLPQVVCFIPRSNSIQLAIEVSNFAYDKGGIWKSILIGTDKQLIGLREQELAISFLIVGALLAMAIYHIVLFFMGRKDYSLLYFGLFCFPMILRTLMTGERILLKILPLLSWSFAMRIELLTVYLSVLIFFLFIHSLFPQEMHKIALYLFSALGIFWSVIALFIPPNLFSFINNGFYFILACASIYCCIILILAFLRKKAGAGMLLAGVVILVITIINDILYAESVIRTSFLAPVGVIFFMLCEYSIYKKYVYAEKIAKTQQEQLIQADKLSSLGTLVAGVTHEINNPNNAIQLTATTLADTWQHIAPVLYGYGQKQGDFMVGGLSYSELKQEFPQSLQRIIRNSVRIKNIIKELKNFSRKDVGEVEKEIDINQLVQSAIKLLESQIQQSTDFFSVSYGKGIPRLRGQFTRLEQVIVNIIQNACQALPDKNTKISISTMFDQKQNQIIIQIVDHGMGMNKETIKKIFDPFFTTKRNQGGTGLGLSISSKIIKDHDGKIEFDSKLNVGTKVEIILPVKKRGD